MEQADLIREQTTLTLISLEDGLESLQLQKTPRQAASPSGSSETSEDDRRSPHIVEVEGHEHYSSGRGVVAPADVVVPHTTDGIVPSTAIAPHSGLPPLITVSASPMTGGIAPPIYALCLCGHSDR